MTLAEQALRDAARERFAWGGGVRWQIIDPDIDGVLSAALLHSMYGWKVLGYFDKATLWLRRGTQVPLDLTSVAWVDIDMAWPGALSISHHVVLEEASPTSSPPALSQAVNPSLLRGNYYLPRRVGYEDKYPFGTFQWLWWFLNVRLELAHLDTPVGRGLAWMPDGGATSVRGKHADNCIRWACDIMPGSLLEPTARTRPSAALADVLSAKQYLQEHSGVTEGWTSSGHWEVTRGVAAGPGGKTSTTRGEPDVQLLTDAVTQFYDMPHVELPGDLDEYRGEWHRGDSIPRWGSRSADPLVCAAFTGFAQARWTEAAPGLSGAEAALAAKVFGHGTLGQALGHPR